MNTFLPGLVVYITFLSLHNGTSCRIARVGSRSHKYIQLNVFTLLKRRKKKKMWYKNWDHFVRFALNLTQHEIFMTVMTRCLLRVGLFYLIILVRTFCVFSKLFYTEIVHFLEPWVFKAHLLVTMNEGGRTTWSWWASDKVNVGPGFLT